MSSGIGTLKTPAWERCTHISNAHEQLHSHVPQGLRLTGYKAGSLSASLHLPNFSLCQCHWCLWVANIFQLPNQKPRSLYGQFPSPQAPHPSDPPSKPVFWCPPPYSHRVQTVIIVCPLDHHICLIPGLPTSTQTSLILPTAARTIFKK